MKTLCFHQSAVARPAVQRAQASRRSTVNIRPFRPAFAHVAVCSRFVVRSTEESTSDASTEEQSADAVTTPLERIREMWESGNATGMEGALADMDAELADLRDRLSAGDERIVSLEGAVTQAKDQLLRLGADFDNFRKRTAGEKDMLASSVKGDVVLQLLPLVDNFELARTQVKAETEGEQKINNAYQGLYKQMVDMMKTLGVEAVETDGIFDPELHEAIMREESTEVPDGTVLQEFRKGFRIGERLLRPAMVKVSYNDAVPAVPPPAESEGEEASS